MQMCHGNLFVSKAPTIPLLLAECRVTVVKRLVNGVGISWNALELLYSTTVVPEATPLHHVMCFGWVADKILHWLLSDAMTIISDQPRVSRRQCSSFPPICCADSPSLHVCSSWHGWSASLSSLIHHPKNEWSLVMVACRFPPIRVEQNVQA